MSANRRWMTAASTIAAVAASLTLAWTPPALAAAPPPLWQVASGSDAGGSGAGELAAPADSASSPLNGDVYVADRANARVDEFDAWGVFVRAWGWGVRDGSPELQVCTSARGCLQGLPGYGPGQFGSSSGMGAIAIDRATGDVYVQEEVYRNRLASADNFRVQKFSASGQFVYMVGGGVDQGPTHPGNICRAQYLTEGDSCGAGSPGTGPREFDLREFFVNDSLAVGPDGSVYVGDKGRIQILAPDGTYQTDLDLPEGENQRAPYTMAADPSTGDLYMAFTQEFYEEPEKPYIYKYTGTLWEQFTKIWLPGDVENNRPLWGMPRSLAVDDSGTLYAGATMRQNGLGIWNEVVTFSPSGECILCPEEGDFARTEDTIFDLIAVGRPCGATSDDVYVLQRSTLTAYGPPPDANVCPPPKKTPSVVSQFATAAGATSATVDAEINPHFWPDTAYYVEYGTGRCAEGGCDQKRPLPPGEPLTEKTIDATLRTEGVLLPDLAPATTYHYRFVAQSSGGGPVYGTGPEPTQAAGGEGTFTTRGPANPPKTDCPNESFRSGSGAFLPDCRAYEQVSPVEKGNGDILQMGDISGYPAGMDQAAPEGEKLTYGTYRAFGDAAGAPYTSQYVASRTATGWASHDVSPPRGTTPLLGEGDTLQATFRAFSSDLCQGWLMQDTDPVLAPGAVEGYANLYRADLCGSGGYEALTTAQPPERLPKEFVPELQDVTEDGRKALFVASAKLTPNAAASEYNQLYASQEGGLELVSVLPDGTPCIEGASAGTANESTGIRTEAVAHAISADGSRIYWSCGIAKKGLYLRLEGDAKSRQIAASNARFWTASPDGSRMIYTAGKTLYAFDAEAKKSIQIATDVLGVAAASEDASRIYFASEEVLTGNETGPAGGVAEAGKPNLYLYEEGAGFRFIGVLSQADATIHPSNNASLSVLSALPVKHAAAATPDGQHLAFVSTAPLTGFDNADAASGNPAAEVYLYDAEAGELRCVSCNPTGIRPAARDLNAKTGGEPYLAAAALAQASSQLYMPRYLSADGSRLFFESFESLVPRDANGAGDVYEFEPGTPEDCTHSGAETYSTEAEGCISLISSGESPRDSEFVDASSNGRDVFFTTASSLVPQDSGLIDIYDAREGGGFPAPAAPRARCEGEACQSPYSAPADRTPASAAFDGAGNAVAKARRHRRRHHSRRRKNGSKPRHHHGRVGTEKDG